ncbi:MAG: class I SAM-dependent methyltransferase [Acidimicrobiales bacterium]
MDDEFSGAWLRWRERVDLDEYNVRWDQLEAQGKSVHDEADFIAALKGDLVLDAGCGTGRVAVELARRGHVVVGIDNDPDMLEYARRRTEPVRWELGNLATFDLADRFDVVALAGNILNFVRSEQRASAVANLARHMNEGGLLVIGSSVAPDCQFDQVDRWCADAGLEVSQQYATWDRQPFAGGDYRVSIHRQQPTV